MQFPFHSAERALPSSICPRGGQGVGAPGSIAGWVQKLEQPRSLGSLLGGMLTEGGNSGAKAEGFPGTYWKLRGSEEGETSGGTLGTPYSACGGQLTADHVVVSITWTGRYPAGFWERLWRASLGQGREPEDHGGFEKVEVAYVVYLFILGTHRVGLVGLMSVSEDPALRGTGESRMTGWAADSFWV